jgi:hypothetical protein
MRFAPACAALLLGSAALIGCGDKAAVQLNVGMQNPALTVTAGALGSSLGGGLDLSLGLGSEASGARTIALGSFSVHGAQDSVVIDPVTVDAGNTIFPLTLAPGDNKSIHLTLGLSRVLSQTEHDALCPGPASITGSVLEDGKANAIGSGALSPTCN